ncbi:hypothetical protein [Paraburkholderia tropica]|uniref:hypothetical protein n=1 Tax=Paraburkholderia tropica TaxID=92647 RepID=UPI003D28B2D7
MNNVSTATSNKFTSVIDSQELLETYSLITTKTDISERRSFPANLLRSPLFGLTRKDDRVDPEKIACLIRTFSITVEGPQLDQHDFDVYSAVCEMWHENYCQRYLQFSGNEIISTLKLKNSGSASIQVKESLRRLAKTSITVSWGKSFYMGNLLPDLYYFDEHQKYQVSFNEKLGAMLKLQSVKLDYAIRKKLRGDLTKWLYNFYMTHVGSQSHTFQKLKSLTGSQSTDFDLNRMLNRALTQLETHGIIEEGWLVSYDPTGKTENKIHVTPKSGKQPEPQIETAAENFTGRGKVAL